VPEHDDEEQSAVVQVAPVVRGKDLPTLPRVVVVALIVGAIAFLAGVDFGAGQPPGIARPTASTGSSAASSSRTTFPVAARPGASEFVGTFRPQDVIAGLDGGAACVSHNISLTDPAAAEVRSGTFVRVWATFCPFEVQKRESFLDQLTNAIGQQTPGSSWSSSSDDLGSTVALFPYAQGQFVGMVTLTAGAAGAGFEIGVTLEERSAQ
jgi:hypothetical protein